MSGTVMPIWSTPRSFGSAVSSPVVGGSSTFGPFELSWTELTSPGMNLSVGRLGVPS
jgi:hypothetical protein